MGESEGPDSQPLERPQHSQTGAYRVTRLHSNNAGYLAVLVSINQF